MRRTAQQRRASRAPVDRKQRPPVLYRDEERALVRAAKARRGDAREQLVDAFGPLVASCARRYRNSPGVERSELLQQGVVGLLRAVERFDTECGTPFWAYAAWWVREAMQQLVSELARPVVLSDRAERQLARVNDARRAHLRERGRDASMVEITARTGLDMHQVANLVAAGRPSRSLEEPVRPDEVDARLEDQIADASAEEAFNAAQRRIDVSMLRPLLQVLSARERRVVTARFGVDGPERTLRELGGDLGISAERVRQIEERALDRLHQAVVPGTGGSAQTYLLKPGGADLPPTKRETACG
jgi:RNA polymerase primary sigma factor